MNRTVLRLALPLVLAATASASSIVLSRGMGTTFYGVYYIPPTSQPAPTPAPAPTVTQPVTTPTVAPSQPVTQPSNTTQTNTGPINTTVVVPGSYNSTLFGTGLTYNLNMVGLALVGSMSVNTVQLGSSQALTYNNYKSGVGATSTVTGATLNVSALIGAMTTQIVSSQGTILSTPTLSGALSNATITIQSGSVSHVVSGTSVAAYDLFANGFASQIAAGAPITISFNVTETVSAATGPISVPWWMQMGRGGAVSGLPETLVFSDSRTITASSALNYLTLYISTPNPQNSLVTPGDPAAVPEPVPTALISVGFVLIGYLRLRKRD